MHISGEFTEHLSTLVIAGAAVANNFNLSNYVLVYLSICVCPHNQLVRLPAAAD